MAQTSRRPRGKHELDDREARGLWNAISLANKVGEGLERITLDTICRIHRAMLGAAYPDVAGRFRRAGEDIKKLQCIEPPPGRLVQERIYAFWREFDTRVSLLVRHPARQSPTQRKRWFNHVLDLAANGHTTGSRRSTLSARGTGGLPDS